MKTQSPSPKPAGIHLILFAGCIAIFGPAINLLVGLREYSVDMMVPRGLIIMSIPLFVVVILPIQLLLIALIQHKTIRPLWRSVIILSPVLILTLPGFLEALFQPDDAKKQFSVSMDHHLPEDSRSFRAWMSHSPGETSYMFSFTATPEWTDGLLASRPYALQESPTMLDPEIGGFFDLPISGYTPPENWPKPKLWNGLKVYTFDVPGGYQYLLTDDNKTRVFILVGDT